MGQIKVHGNTVRRLKINPVELPTLETPWGQFNEWFRTLVLPKLDISAKWMGCWMWTGATAENGEPRFNYRSLVREEGRVGKRKTRYVKTEMMDQLKVYDASKVPRRRYKGEDLIDTPDMDIVHLCGNPSCLNPNHFIICLDDTKQRDIIKLRDKYLVPGSYWNGDPV